MCGSVCAQPACLFVCVCVVVFAYADATSTPIHMIRYFGMTLPEAHGVTRPHFNEALFGEASYAHIAHSKLFPARPTYMSKCEQ